MPRPKADGAKDFAALALNHPVTEFFRTAYVLGYHDCSKSNYVRMGAVVVRRVLAGLQIIGVGTDQLKLGAPRTALSYEPGYRDVHVIEAPTVAMEGARVSGAKVRGCHIYTPGMPSERCINDMASKGIEMLIIHTDFNKYVRQHDASWDIQYRIAERALAKNKIELRTVECNISTPTHPAITVFRGDEYFM